MPPIEDQIHRTVADALQLPPDSLTPDSSTKTVPKWDSVGHVTLVLALEEQFNIQFEPEEIEMMKSVAIVIDTVTKKLAN